MLELGIATIAKLAAIAKFHPSSKDSYQSIGNQTNSPQAIWQQLTDDGPQMDTLY